MSASTESGAEDEPTELRTASDVVLVCQALGLIRNEAFTDPAWEQWMDPERWVAVRFDRSGSPRPGLLQVHVGFSSGFFAVYLANRGAIPTACVRVAVEQIRADARARGVPDFRTVSTDGGEAA